MFKALVLVVAAVGSMSFGGCAGGGPGAASGILPSPGPSPVVVKTAQLTFRIEVPIAGTTTTSAALRRPASSILQSASSARHPLFISPSTQSIGIQEVTAGTFVAVSSVVTANMTSGSSNCSGSPLICTVTETLPLGAVTFQVGLYAGLNGTGTLLGEGSATGTVVAGTDNALGLSIGGVVASITSGGCTFTAGTPGTCNLSLVPKDAGNNTIIGEGAAGTQTLPNGDVITTGNQLFASTLTATLAAANGMTLSPTYLDASNGCAATNSVTALLCVPEDTIAIPYNGVAGVATTLTLTRNDNASHTIGNVTMTAMSPQVITIAPALSAIVPSSTSESLIVGGSSASLQVSETGWTASTASSIATPFGQTFTMADSSCSGIATVTAGSVTASGEAFVVAPVGQGSCTATFIENETGVYAAPHSAISLPITVAYGSLVPSPTSLTWANNVTGTQTETISEAGYSGTIAQSISACKINSTSNASLSSNVSSGSAPASFVLTPLGGSTCNITYTDSHGGSLTVPVSITASGVVIH